MSADSLFEAMAGSIIEGEAEEAQELASKALAEGIKPLDAIDKGFVVGINEVGRAFGCQEKFLPDLVRAGESLKAALNYYLTNPKADQDTRLAFLERECTFLDGSAGRHTAEFMLSLIRDGSD